MAIQNPIIAVLVHPELDVGCIRGSDLGFGHEECGTDLAVQERTEPSLLLLFGAVLGEDFHVAGIWRGTVHCLHEQSVSINPKWVAVE